MTKVVHLPRFRIARLEPCQIDDAAKLLYETWHESYGKRLPAGLLKQSTRHHFERHIERRGATCWLAWIGGRLVGLTTTISNCLDDIWVSRRYRRRGVATRLIEAACCHLAQRGFRAVQTGCEDFNHAASSLFEGLGWRKVGAELVHTAPGVRHEALVYTHSLPLSEAS